jgi:hypothetical protein
MNDLTVEPVTSFRVRRLTVPIPGVRTFQARYERRYQIFLSTACSNW